VVELRICIDVDELQRGIAFYTSAFDLTVARRFGQHWAELVGASSTIDLLAVAGEKKPVPGSSLERSFARHWTPVHLDFVVHALDAAVARALAQGARLERPIREEVYGRIANLADPFGHGVCLLELTERGYDALAEPVATG
jgi:predicted enzyme related to lactoylglutathione lyase